VLRARIRAIWLRIYLSRILSEPAWFRRGTDRSDPVPGRPGHDHDDALGRQDAETGSARAIDVGGWIHPVLRFYLDAVQFHAGIGNRRFLLAPDRARYRDVHPVRSADHPGTAGPPACRHGTGHGSEQHDASAGRIIRYCDPYDTDPYQVLHRVGQPDRLYEPVQYGIRTKATTDHTELCEQRIFDVRCH